MTRTGWRAGPVRPESAAFPARSDPGRLGALTFPIRWPRTCALLTGEFQLSRAQAWEVARTARHHRGLRAPRAGLFVRLALIALLISPAAVVFVALPLWTVFIASTIRDGDPSRLHTWYAAIAASVALAVLVGWALVERFGMDRLIDRRIRACWGERVCLWCGQDMDESAPSGDRWAVCPECGMRSPVAVRTR
jgi:DNA-directed RNA polymerase subunit RPC12/RpoP